MSTLTTISASLPERITKESIALAGAQFSQMVIEEGKPLQAYIRLKALRAAVDAAISELEGDAIDEAEKYGPSDSVIAGVSFTVRNGSKRYKYDSDGQWRQLKMAIKEREELLQALPTEMVDPETGEFVSPAEEVYTKASLVVTFPREK